jgi:diguanylate cyclase (GGDEF)-like protein
MAVNLERRRALLAADDQQRGSLRALFGTGPLEGWDAVQAISFEQARFILQMQPCDVLLLDGSLYPSAEADGLAWLAAQNHAPVLFLADPDPGVVLSALQHRANHWLPRALALGQPAVLAAVLDQAAQLGDLRRQARAAGEALQDCRQQVSRLVSLLWDSLPTKGQTPWLTQRQVMERLQEEVARSSRHGDPLTVVLGELQVGQRERITSVESEHLATWSAERISRTKRRCDVAGQYGQHGFLLLLPHTVEEAAVQCCRRLQAILERPQPPEAISLAPLQACFGIARFAPATATAKSLLSRAEERLERAKVGGERIES